MSVGLWFSLRGGEGGCAGPPPEESGSARRADRRRRSDPYRRQRRPRPGRLPRRATGALLTPAEALETLEPGDCAIGRIDVLPTLDGVDDGLWALGALEARGVTVLNGAPSLLAAHDKLLTARLLRRAGLPHPRTRLISGDRPSSPLRAAGRRQAALRELGPRRRALRRRGVARRAARAAAGRAVVSGARRARAGARAARSGSTSGSSSPTISAIGAISRVAAPGEWRTNVALGAERRQATPPPDAVALALAAARATGAALVGVDLLPDGRGGWTVVEINGAVEFTSEYALRPGARPVRRGRLPARPGGDLRRLREPAPEVPRSASSAEGRRAVARGVARLRRC